MSFVYVFYFSSRILISLLHCSTFLLCVCLVSSLQLIKIILSLSLVFQSVSCSRRAPWTAWGVLWCTETKVGFTDTPGAGVWPLTSLLTNLGQAAYPDHLSSFTTKNTLSSLHTVADHKSRISFHQLCLLIV